MDDLQLLFNWFAVAIFLFLCIAWSRDSLVNLIVKALMFAGLIFGGVLLHAHYLG